MTSLKIVIDGETVREWTLSNIREAKKAEQSITKFIQDHIEEETIKTFFWNEQE